MHDELRHRYLGDWMDRNATISARWRTAPVPGVWQIEVTELLGHRLSVRRTTAGSIART